MTDMMFNMLTDMLVDYAPFMGSVLIFMAITSYSSKGFGALIGIVFTILSFLGSFMLLIVGGLAILIVGFLVFPTIVWTGFFLGGYFRRKGIAKIT